MQTRSIKEERKIFLTQQHTSSASLNHTVSLLFIQLFHSCTGCQFRYLPATLSHPKAVKWHADICVVLQVWKTWQIFRIIRNQKCNLQQET